MRLNRRVHQFFSATLLVFVFGQLSQGQLLTERFRISPLDVGFEDPNQTFVNSLATNGDLIVSGSLRGSVFVYDAHTGEVLRQLQPEGGLGTEDVNLFGNAVAMDDNFIVVGNRGEGDQGFKSGAAYVFDVQTGAQLHKLLPNDGHDRGAFGISIDIDNGIAIIGSNSGTQQGSAYLFDLNTGEQLQRFAPGEDVPLATEFGTSVSLSGNLAVVGAPEDSRLVENGGAVYIFDATSGEELELLIANDPMRSDFWGDGVSADSVSLLISAPGKQSAFLYSWAALADPVELSLADLGPSISSARRVALGREFAVATGLGGGKNTPGVAGVFEVPTGRLLWQLSDTVAAGFQNFGLDVAVEQDTLAVGANNQIIVFNIPEPTYSWRWLALCFLVLVRQQLFRKGRNHGSKKVSA